MATHLQPILRQAGLFSRSGISRQTTPSRHIQPFRYLRLLYRAGRPLLLLLAFVLSGCLSEQVPTEEETTLVHVGDEAPRFTVGMLDGSESALPDLQGDVVLLTFFSTWCPTCREQMQQMQTRIVDRFAGRKFRFLPINRGETQQTVEAFCRELSISFPVGLDPDMTIYSLYATRYVPRNFIIGADGTVLLAETDYDEAMQTLLIERIEQALQAAEYPLQSASPE